MRAFLLTLLFVGAAFSLSACAAFGVADSAKDRVGDAAADVVFDYCERTSETDQDALRERMDERTYPHVVRVECAE